MHKFTKLEISSLSDSLGFDDFAIYGLDKPIDEDFLSQFKEWLNSPLAGNLDYMHKYLDIRIKPKLLLDNAKSLICFIANFKRDTQEKRIATYAQSRDYHKVIPKKLKVIAKHLESLGGTQKICVDTSPIFEKYFAQKCNLGYRGKNTLLVNEKFGSFCFIGIILTTLDFQEYIHAQPTISCDNCDKCIKACPVEALSPYKLDASKCINAITIEEARDFEINGKKYIFGCDTCLQVCPHAKNAPLPKMQEFNSALPKLPQDTNLSQLEELSLGTPIYRTYKKYTKIMSNKNTSFIFDFDGTIANTIPMAIDAFKYAIKTLGLKVPSPEEIFANFGPSEDGYLARFYPEKKDELFALYLKYYDKHHQEYCPSAFPLIKESLLKIKSSGAKLGLITGKAMESAIISFKHIGIDMAIFDFIKTGEPSGNVKQKHMQEAIDALKSGEDDTFYYIGDAKNDIIDAKAKNMLSISAAWSPIDDIEVLKAQNPYKIFYKTEDFKAFLDEIL
ncbi:MAG: QueG-associated DUF1730 domain-containing protein [Opitutales bacterium]